MKIIESNPVGRLLSHCEYAALEYLHEHGPAPLSSIGYMVREKVPEKVQRKRNPSPQLRSTATR